MKEVIARMLVTEEEARSLLSDAEREADRIMADSREQASLIEETARRQVQDEASRLVSTAERESREQHDEQLAQAHLDAEKMIESVATREDAVELVLRTLLGDER